MCIAQVFTSLLHSIPLVVVDTRREADDVKEVLKYASDYHTAIRCQLLQKEPGTPVARQMELAAYFTHCRL